MPVGKPAESDTLGKINNVSCTLPTVKKRKQLVN